MTDLKSCSTDNKLTLNSADIPGLKEALEMGENRGKKFCWYRGILASWPDAKKVLEELEKSNG